jgi:hypothetical protein
MARSTSLSLHSQCWKTPPPWTLSNTHHKIPRLFTNTNLEIQLTSSRFLCQVEVVIAIEQRHLSHHTSPTLDPSHLNPSHPSAQPCASHYLACLPSFPR